MKTNPLLDIEIIWLYYEKAKGRSEQSIEIRTTLLQR